MKKRKWSYYVVILFLNLFLFACEKSEPRENNVPETGKAWSLLKKKLEAKERGKEEWKQIERYGESVLKEIAILYGGGHGWYFTIPVKSSSGELEKVIVYPIVTGKFQEPVNGVLKEQIQIDKASLKANPSLRSYLPPGKFDELAGRDRVKQDESSIVRENLSRSFYPENTSFKVTYTWNYWVLCQKDGQYPKDGPIFCLDKELKIFNQFFFAYEMTSFDGEVRVRMTRGAVQVIFYTDGMNIDRTSLRYQAEDYFFNVKMKMNEIQDTEVILDPFESYASEEYDDLRICDDPEFYVDWTFEPFFPRPDYSFRFPLPDTDDEDCSCEFEMSGGGGGGDVSWNETTHHGMIDEIAKRLNLTKEQINTLKEANDYADSFLEGNQFSSKAYLHAMNTDPNQSQREARAIFEKHLIKTFGSYVTRGSYHDLGVALHGVSDSFCPSHRGFQYYSWTLSNIKEHAKWDKGENSPSIVAGAIDGMIEILNILNGVTPAQPGDTRGLVERAVEAWGEVYEYLMETYP